MKLNTVAGKTVCRCKNCVCLKSEVGKGLFCVYIMQVLQKVCLIVCSDNELGIQFYSFTR
jgi:hypothetical protein